MKILVCISKAPDTTTKISFTDGDTKFDESGVKYIVNPYDEWYALVRGLELKEAHGGSVTTVTVGTAEDDATIRKALAIGADDATRINVKPEDASQVAAEIAAYAKEGAYDLVLLGKETIDYNGSQVGGMIAEHLDMPFISLAEKLDVDGTTATLDKEITGGVQTVEAELPLVVSCAKGMAEQRIPNMRGIMAARKKPLNVVEPTNAAKQTSFVKYALPAPKSAVKLIDPNNMDELVELLHNEAKVI
ncbi:electron transfer flavoprotein subunit beta/FixA family protein [Brumimicrobium aurantiacum]|uniref:Electron transfer flavoprotein subunit beta n=1 Tax=Brumimicrobium aurantiacum TaxID=1737063 RepID=A0A3E1EYX4_9FLAO|nr:electron transfer flavoprotein subunit beta/FixA family protein [Brumimicrobium aurantiacum]RFC54756.1 electron transfer flavoprotein beta subunit/FixA family protein [Brumimicrobium aurantiacum]